MPQTGCPPRTRFAMTECVVSPAALQSLAPLALVTAALWPVWRYLALAHLGPGGDPAGVCLLLGVVIAAIGLRSRPGPSPPADASPAVPVLLLAYALGSGLLPPLALAFLGLTAFCAP